MKDGLRFTWKMKGLSLLFMMAGFIKIFFFTGVVLILPLFQRNAALGPVKYGIVMAAGGVLGEFFPIKYIISFSFIVIGILCIPLLFSKSLKEFICYDETVS